MNLTLLLQISRKISGSRSSSGFLNFARTIAFCSVLLGSLALIISLSILEGFDQEISNNAAKYSSHFQITGFNYSPVKNFDKKIKELSISIPEIASIQPVNQKECLIRTQSGIEGIIVKGVSQSYGKRELFKYIKEGDFCFSSDSAREIALGERLAQKLGVKTGEKIVLLTNSDTASEDLFPQISQFKVIAIYSTGLTKYDEISAFMPFTSAARFFSIADSAASLLEVNLANINDVERLHKKIEQAAGAKSTVTTIYELHASLFSWIELQKAPIPLVLGLITIVAVFNIITILLVTIVEKTRTIGILRSLGMSGKSLLAIFVFQGTIVGLAGSVAGCLLGLGFDLLQSTFSLISLNGEIYYVDHLPVSICLWHHGVVIGTAFIFSFFASLLPSIAAIKVSPIKVIRYS